jgi:hypothetical protein
MTVGRYDHGARIWGRAIFTLCMICFHFMRDNFHFMRELTYRRAAYCGIDSASDNGSYVRNLPNPVPLAL